MRKKREYIKKWNILEEPDRCGIRYYVHHRTQSIQNHAHNFIEIEYISDGEMEHLLNGVPSHISRGDCYCLDTRDWHEKCIPSSVTIHNLCLIFKQAPPSIQRLLSSVTLPLAGRIAEDMRDTVEEWFSRLGEYLSSDEPYAEERATAYAMLIISQVLESSSPVVEKLPTSGYRHIAKAISYISEHYGERLLLSDVARAVYLSPNHFSKLFCEVTGIPFSDHLTRLRIERACVALMESDRSVTDIAMECGFSSFSTFSRSFKKILSCTPTEYRSAHSTTI